MQWIYYGSKESTLIQAFLLFWSLYGIYVAVMKNKNFNKKISYRILQEDKHKKILYWYVGNQCVNFSNYLNYIVKTDNDVEKIEVNSNCKIDDFKLKDNKIVISKKGIVKNNIIEIDLYSQRKVTDVTIETDDMTSFEFVENKKKSLVIFIIICFILISLFFNSLTPLISSFVDVKWNDYYLFEEAVKQYGVELDYGFEDEYASIYDTFHDRDTRNYEIKVAILNQYGKIIPSSIFVEMEEETLLTRVKSILECISIVVILLFWSIKYFYTLPPIKDKTLKHKYSVKCRGNIIYFRKFMNGK